MKKQTPGAAIPPSSSLSFKTPSPCLCLLNNNESRCWELSLVNSLWSGWGISPSCSASWGMWLLCHLSDSMLCPGKAKKFWNLWWPIVIIFQGESMRATPIYYPNDQKFGAKHLPVRRHLAEAWGHAWIIIHNALNSSHLLWELLWETPKGSDRIAREDG